MSFITNNKIITNAIAGYKYAVSILIFHVQQPTRRKTYQKTRYEFHDHFLSNQFIVALSATQ